jgi:hypothetical protein
MKELKIASDESWDRAQILIGAKMLRDPACMSLAYINPFKSRRGAKIPPTSLTSEEEWDSLVNHIKTHLQANQAKNRGKGGTLKPFTIVIVDIGGDSSTEKVRCNINNRRRISAQFLFQSGTISKGKNPKSIKTEEPELEKEGDIVAAIERQHHCPKCDTACYIDPGPPVQHKAYSFKQLTIWASLVVCTLKYSPCK